MFVSFIGVAGDSSSAFVWGVTPGAAHPTRPPPATAALRELSPDPVREYPQYPRVRLFSAKEGHKGMECPHCLSEFDVKPHVFALGQDQDGSWQVSNTRCPTCDRLIVSLCTKEGCTYPAWPASSTRARLSDDVPADFAGEYHAACQVLFYSPEASAAISRRSLHRFLATRVHAGHGGLADQIRQAVISPELPGYLKQALQKLSQVANLEHDSTKSLRPEAVASVEPGEAEWLLDVLQPLFDLYFVQPARMQRKQDVLEETIAPPAPLAVADEETESAAAIDVADAADPTTVPGATVAVSES